MNGRYVVGYINWYDNDLKHVIVEANDALEAMIKAGAEHFGFDVTNDTDNFSDVETFKQYCFDCDCMMDAIQI